MFKVVGETVLVDFGKMKELGLGEFVKAQGEIQSHKDAGRTVRFVDTLDNMFTKAALVIAIREGREEDARFAAEGLGIEIAEQEWEAVRIYHSLLGRVTGGEMRYGSLCSTKKVVECGGYHIKIDRAKRLTIAAMAVWRSGGKDVRVCRDTFYGQMYNVYVREEHVAIGCVAIPRADIEMMAAAKGWV